MIFSTTILAETPQFDNIEVEEENGELILKLTEAQYKSLADYWEELEYENKVLEAKLEQANKEIEKAYEDKEDTLDLTNIAVKGAVLASIISAIALFSK